MLPSPLWECHNRHLMVFVLLGVLHKSNCTVRTFIFGNENITASLSCVFSEVTNAFQKGLPREVYGEAVSV